MVPKRLVPIVSRGSNGSVNRVERKSIEDGVPNQRTSWGGKLWELYCVAELGIAGYPRTLQNVPYLQMRPP